MGWKSGSSFFVAPGSTIRLAFSWGGADKGSQWVQGHVLNGEAPARLWTERVAKELMCDLGQIIVNGSAEFSCVETSDKYRYLVDIKSDGPEGTRFRLEGGNV